MKGLLGALLARGRTRSAQRDAAVGYPVNPIRIVVPFARGGITDVAARLLRVNLEPVLGQRLHVENQGGAGGTKGAESVARSTPDGYTLLMGSCGEMAIGPVMQPGIGYDPLKDFVPIVLVTVTPLLIVASADAPFRSLEELIARAAESRHALAYATPGLGGPHHVTGEWLRHLAGIGLLNVSYDGGAPAVADVVRGRVPLGIVAPTPAIPHLRSGRIRVLATTTLRPNALTADWATVADAGYAGFDTSMWVGLFAPTGTPSPVVMRLNSEVNRVLQLAEVRADLEAQGGSPAGGTPDAFAAFIRSETAKYERVIGEAGIRPLVVREQVLQVSR
jgi:tripartite-type tricarboxylate transporter receptor subunit TctC